MDGSPPRPFGALVRVLNWEAFDVSLTRDDIHERDGSKDRKH